MWDDATPGADVSPVVPTLRAQLLFGAIYTGQPPTKAEVPNKNKRLCRGGEEVDEQLVDSFSLVVMHPVRRLGQASTGRIGHVVACGWRGAAEVRSPSPQMTSVGAGTGRIFARLLLGQSYRGAVVVDHPAAAPGWDHAST